MHTFSGAPSKYIYLASRSGLSDAKIPLLESAWWDNLVWLKNIMKIYGGEMSHLLTYIYMLIWSV